MSTKILRAVDGVRLPNEYRVLLRPGEIETDVSGTVHRLPRFFYAIAGWQGAHEIRLVPHFTLAELMLVDCREVQLLLSRFPHYVPCSIVLLARLLEDFRRELMPRSSSAQTAATARPRIRLADHFPALLAILKQSPIFLALENSSQVLMSGINKPALTEPQ